MILAYLTEHDLRHLLSKLHLELSVFVPLGAIVGEGGLDIYTGCALDVILRLLQS